MSEKTLRKCTLCTNNTRDQPEKFDENIKTCKSCLSRQQERFNNGDCIKFKCENNKFVQREKFRNNNKLCNECLAKKKRKSPKNDDDSSPNKKVKVVLSIEEEHDDIFSDDNLTKMNEEKIKEQERIIQENKEIINLILSKKKELEEENEKLENIIAQQKQTVDVINDFIDFNMKKLRKENKI